MLEIYPYKLAIELKNIEIINFLITYVNKNNIHNK